MSNTATANDAGSTASRKPSLAARVWAPGSSTPVPTHLSAAALRISLTAFCLGTMAGFALPRAASAVQQMMTYSILCLLRPSDSQGADRLASWLRPQLHLYLLAWALFHMLEFVITARWNATRLYSDCTWAVTRMLEHRMTDDVPMLCSLSDLKRNLLPSRPSLWHHRVSTRGGILSKHQACGMVVCMRCVGALCMLS